MRSYTLQLLITCLCVGVIGMQEASAQAAKLKRARMYMEALDYVEAIKMYNLILEDHDVAEAKINLAEAYRKVNDTGNAEFWYGQVVRLPEATPYHKLYYGMMLQRNGKCELAREWYQQFVEAVPDDLRGQYLLRACDYEEELMKKNADIYEVEHCDFNSDLDDFGPALYKEGLVFASERDRNPVVRREHMWTGNPFLELYYVPVKEMEPGENGACGIFMYGRPDKFSNTLNSKFHDATVAFTRDYSEIYFTRNNLINGKVGTDDEGIIRLKIFYAKSLGEGQWGEMQSLPFNSDEYSVAHPTLSPDGNKLYFASDMPGGFGGMDLYVSERESGRWGPPMNLGPDINTEGHEVFPYYSAADGRLYFASDGHIGLGGLDIFYVEDKGNGTWSEPVNLGYPINTNADDFSITFNENGTCGYFASDRAGGAGRDDIYFFRKVATPVEVFVYDAKTQQAIEGAEVYLDCKDVTLTTGYTGKFSVDLKLNECCNFLAKAEGYEPANVQGCTHNITLGQKVVLEIPMMPATDFELMGTVYDDATGLPMEGAVVTLENDCGQPAAEPIITDIDGRFYFKLDKDCCYKVKAVKDKYLAAVEEGICTRGKEESETFKVVLHMQPTVMVPNADLTQRSPQNETEYTYRDLTTGLWIDKDTQLPAEGVYPDGREYSKGELITGNETFAQGPTPINETFEEGQPQPVPYLLHIYYDFDDYHLRDDAIPELEKLLKMLQENPDYIVEVASHTDARGSKRYNLKLSQKRANEVVKWLVAHGVDRDRLVPRGYGETRPVNDCADYVPCNERDHQLNRRTEFRVIGCRSCVDPAKAILSKPNEQVRVDECKHCPF